MLFSLLGLKLPAWVLIAILLAYVAVLVISLGLHEFAHAYAAYRNGDYTAKNMGRMSINPFVHFNAYGFVCLMLLGFGWAEPVPVNPYYLTRGKKSMFQVAVAGVTANLLLAILFSIVYGALVIFAPGFLLFGGFWSVLVNYLLNFGLYINLSLAIFNLIPLYPLDGSKILELVVKPESKLISFLQRYSMLILLALLLFGVISYIVEIATSFLGSGLLFLWSYLFGLMV